MTAARPQDHIGSAALSALLMGGLLWVLIVGLAVRLGPLPIERPGVLNLVPPPPRPPVIHEPVPSQRARARAGQAAAAGLLSTAAEVVAPKPLIPPPPPMAAAPVANTGVQAMQGAAPVAGPGTGAGGVGDGFGAGEGDGPGGGGEGRDTPPRRIAGRISPGDLPDDLADTLESGVDLVVGVRYAVEVDGNVDECSITHSSGSRPLDILTCELIERKFRYRPALDEDHAPFKAYIVENHIWNFEDARGGRR